jgi:hypothetical protein
MTFIAYMLDMEALKTQGFYGNPINSSWFIQQLLSFLVVVAFSKVIVSTIMLQFKDTMTFLSDEVSKIVILKYGPQKELIIVNVIGPCIVSIIQVCLFSYHSF